MQKREEKKKEEVKKKRKRGNGRKSKEERIYKKYGVTEIDPGYELSHEPDVPLMFTKHCIKYSLGFCPKYQVYRNPIAEPLYLVYLDKKLSLSFNFKECEMRIYFENVYQ